MENALSIYLNQLDLALIPRVMSGLGISILSTSKGVMSGGSAKQQKLGGELLAYVW